MLKKKTKSVDVQLRIGSFWWFPCLLNVLDCVCLHEERLRLWVWVCVCEPINMNGSADLHFRIKDHHADFELYAPKISAARWSSQHLKLTVHLLNLNYHKNSPTVFCGFCKSNWGTVVEKKCCFLIILTKFFTSVKISKVDILESGEIKVKLSI